MIDQLHRSDRRLLERIADDAGVPVDALLPEIVAAYLRLLKDAPAVLPRDPLSPIARRARGARR
ncbi:MAG: hypothetical protein ACU0AT_13200 [Tranquillimonas sp.]